MAMMFEQLAKKTVHIGMGNGKYIEVPMLPLADLAKFQEMQKEFTKAKDNAAMTDTQRIEVIMQGRESMLEMAKKVMPVELHDNVARMDVAELSKLLVCLFTGNDDAAADDPQKKITLPSQMAKTV